MSKYRKKTIVSVFDKALVLLELYDLYGQKAVDYVNSIDASTETIINMMKRGIIA